MNQPMMWSRSELSMRICQAHRTTSPLSVLIGMDEDCGETVERLWRDCRKSVPGRLGRDARQRNDRKEGRRLWKTNDEETIGETEEAVEEDAETAEELKTFRVA